MIQIDRGIPIPPSDPRKKGRPLKWQWDLLEVGDSTMVESANQARTASLWASRNGRRFISAKQAAAPLGWRVWRVS